MTVFRDIRRLRISVIPDGVMVRKWLTFLAYSATALTKGYSDTSLKDNSDISMQLLKL